MAIRSPARTPGKDKWLSTGIKSDRYELRTNGRTVTLWFDGKILPHQTDIDWSQKMDDVVSVTVTLLFG